MADYSLEGVIKLRDQTKQATDSAQKGVSGLEKAVKAAGAALAAFGVQQAAKAALELGELGAQAQRTERGFVTISGGALAAGDNLQAMRRATRGAISDIDAMQAANQLMQMGLVNNADELEEVTTAAVRLGTAMGRTANESISEFAALLANQSLPRLDTFGISSGKVRARILELQAATEGLSREQAFNIAVMEEAEQAMGRLGDAQGDQLLVIERNQAAWKNLKVEVGQVYSEFIALGGFMPTFLQGLSDNVRLAREAGANFSDLGTNVVIFADALGITIPAMDRLRQQQELANAIYQTGQEINLRYAETVDDVSLSVDDLAAANVGLMQVSSDLTQTQDGLTAAWYEGAAALEGLGAAQLIKMQLDQLKASVDAGTLSNEEYNEVARAMYQQFGLLTEAEIEAQSAIDGLTQQLIDGKIGPEEYALAVQNLKNELDGIPREIPITFKFNSEGSIPALPGGGDLTDPAKYGGMAAGGVTGGGWDWVGERGPELRYMQPGTRIIDNQTSQQISNQTINLYGASGMAFVVDQARRAKVR